MLGSVWDEGLNKTQMENISVAGRKLHFPMIPSTTRQPQRDEQNLVTRWVASPAGAGATRTWVPPCNNDMNTLETKGCLKRC